MAMVGARIKIQEKIALGGNAMVLEPDLRKWTHIWEPKMGPSISAVGNQRAGLDREAEASPTEARKRAILQLL
jgi:hypothetical protein